ncbi:MAG: hypothetical protein IKW74_02660, partial [Thermoguttaceae bacterium]|nr:hypothetical protein [Thermoguttaceae bacterium]
MPPVETLSGLPAPFWFIEFFKILGFVLHSIPMHLWLVGLPMGLFLLLIGGPNARYFAKRLLKSLPVITAIGINLGVVPFLFVQTAYYKAFYPASILTAVHWMSLILLVLIAYASLYFCSFSVGKKSVIKPLLFGLLATVCFVAAGLIFSSTWTLMSDPNAWPVIWSKTQIAGAVTGLGTYWNNPAVFVRFISIVGLGFITLSFWLVFDAVVLSPQKTALSFEEEYALLEAEEARKAQEA